jgi:hypothetical protein
MAEGSKEVGLTELIAAIDKLGILNNDLSNLRGFATRAAWAERDAIVQYLRKVAVHELGTEIERLADEIYRGDHLKTACKACFVGGSLQVTTKPFTFGGGK